MVDYIARAMNEERLRKFEDTRCPRHFCFHEYRDETPHNKPIPHREG